MTVAARSWTAGVGVAATLAMTAVVLATPHGASGAGPDDTHMRASGSPRPMVAYAGSKNVVVLDQDGAVLTRVPRGTGGFSLGRGLLAKGYNGASSARTVGYDARDGERRFRVTDTQLIPTVVGRRAVAFLGQAERDPYATSLWLRGRGGGERKLVQFSFGPGTPGVPTGMTEGMVLDYSFDSDADVAAVVAGNDYIDFRYDIWVVDVGDRTSTRLTKGQRSRYPAVSPAGAEVAYFREETVCGGPMPGYRSGDLVVVGADAMDRRTVHDGSCDQYLDRFRWLDDSTVVAVSHTRRPGPDPEALFDSELVLVDVASGEVSTPIGLTDRVGEVSVSPSLGSIAYTSWTEAKGFWVFEWQPGSGDPAPSTQGTTRRFDVGRVPHLNGDPTLIPSY